MNLEFCSAFGSFAPSMRKLRAIPQRQDPPYPRWEKEKPAADGFYWARPRFSRQRDIGAGVVIVRLEGGIILYKGMDWHPTTFTHFAGPLRPPEEP